MSNLRDTTEFLAEDSKKYTNKDLHIVPSNGLQGNPQELLSPESPESRRPPLLQQNEFDPKLQWQKVMKRLNMHRDHDDSASFSSSSSINSDIRQQQKYHYNDEYDILPDTEEIDNQSLKVKEEDEKNFFKNPFKEEKKESPEEPASTSNMIQPTTAVEADVKEKDDQHGKVRKHWGKTLDKVRLIANLHSTKKQPSSNHVALVPYYPPLFDPVFLALSSDRRGNPWVSNQFCATRSLHLTLFIY